LTLQEIHFLVVAVRTKPHLKVKDRFAALESKPYQLMISVSAFLQHIKNMRHP